MLEYLPLGVSPELDFNTRGLSQKTGLERHQCDDTFGTYRHILRRDGRYPTEAA